MTEVKCVDIQFKPTGNVFKIPVKEAYRLLEEDRGNYVVLDKDFVFPVKDDVVETTTFEQVVEDDKQADEQQDDKKEPTFKEVLEKKKVKELIEYCDENKIEYDKNDKKADLINKILANAEKKEDMQDKQADEQQDVAEQVITEEKTEE